MEFVSSAEELLRQFRRVYVDDALWYEFWGVSGAGSTRAEQLQLKIQKTLGSVGDYVWEGEGVCFENDIRHIDDMWCLRGKTWVGENTDDEWLTLWALIEATKGTDVLLRTWDSDGDVILIEASAHIPKWMRPENSLHRVWIRDGLVHLIAPSKPDLHVFKRGKDLPSLSRAEALRIMRTAHERYVADDAVQRAVQSRVRGFPQRARDAMHHSVCILPSIAAALISSNRQLLSSAVRAFCVWSQESRTEGSISKLKHTAPRNAEDFVCVRVRMSRWHYAQLKSHTFGSLKQFSGAASVYNSVDGGEAAVSLGSKLAFGFELLCTRTDAEFNIPRGLAAADLAQECSRLRSLEPLTLSTAIAQMVVHRDHIAAASEDDSWMYCTPEEFERNLGEAAQLHVPKVSPISGADDLATFSNIVSGVRTFMDSSVSYEGAEVPSMAEQPERATLSLSFDMLRDMLAEEGYVIEGSTVIPLCTSRSHGTPSQSSGVDRDAPLFELEDYFSSDEDERDSEDQVGDVCDRTAKALLLAASGFVAHEDTEPEIAESAVDSDDCAEEDEDDESASGFMEEYMRGMDEELADTCIADGFSRDSGAVDVEQHLLNNLLESLIAQGAGAGPASNLLGEMGLQLLRPKVEAQQ
jgi:hypothetical protein